MFMIMKEIMNYFKSKEKYLMNFKVKELIKKELSYKIDCNLYKCKSGGTADFSGFNNPIKYFNDIKYSAMKLELAKKSEKC